MDLKLLNGTSGPLTNYLRSTKNKKKLLKSKTPSKMSSRLPKIRVVTDDTSRNTVTIKNPVSLDKIDIMSDSGSSVVSMPRNTPSEIKEVPKKKFIPKMPQSTFNPSELEYFANSQKHKPVVERTENESEEEEEEEEEYDEDEEEYNGDENDYLEDEQESYSRPSNKELEKRKRELLLKLIGLENKGVELTKKFSLKSKFEDIEFEYETQKKQLEIEAGVKFQQKALMAFVTGLEFVNNKFDPVGAKLDGWSESVMESINDYDSVFRKLYEKYSSRAELPPELELLMTLIASGFMFHLTNSFFKSNLPAVGSMMQNNPDIMKNIAAAMSQKSPQSQTTTPGEMSGPSLDLSSLMGGFNKVGPPPPVNTSQEKEVDRFSVASSNDSQPISTISKSGKKTVNIM